MKISFLILINVSWINVVLDRINLSEGIENKSIKDKMIKEQLKADKKSRMYQHFLTNENSFNRALLMIACLFWIIHQLGTHLR